MASNSIKHYVRCMCVCVWACVNIWRCFCRGACVCVRSCMCVRVCEVGVTEWLRATSLTYGSSISSCILFICACVLVCACKTVSERCWLNSNLKPAFKGTYDGSLRCSKCLAPASINIYRFVHRVKATQYRHQQYGIQILEMASHCSVPKKGPVVGLQDYAQLGCCVSKCVHVALWSFINQVNSKTPNVLEFTIFALEKASSAVGLLMSACWNSVLMITVRKVSLEWCALLALNYEAAWEGQPTLISNYITASQLILTAADVVAAFGVNVHKIVIFNTEEFSTWCVSEARRVVNVQQTQQLMWHIQLQRCYFK